MTQAPDPRPRTPAADIAAAASALFRSIPEGPDLPTLGAAAEKKLEQGPEDPPPDLAKDPRNNREYAFDLAYTDARGTTYAGRFVSKILTFKERLAVVKMTAQILDNTPVEAVDGLDRFHAEIAAHMQICLLTKPKWAEDFGGLDEDGAVLTALWSKVRDHRDFYFRRGDHESSGAGTS